LIQAAVGSSLGAGEDDALGLWRGKRLTGTEQRLEATLRRLRAAPGARADLQVVEG
jgi:hypothetical protein